MVYFHSIRAAVMALAVCFVVLAFVLCIASALRLPVANPYVHKALNVVRNENFDKLQGDYLFPEIGRRRNAYLAENPDAKLVSLGIGDNAHAVQPSEQLSPRYRTA